MLKNMRRLQRWTSCLLCSSSARPPTSLASRARPRSGSGPGSPRMAPTRAAGAAAAEQGKLPQQRQGGPEAQEKKQAQGRPWLTPEFDGLNCFETIVSH
ncbi:hypothetical protein Taro_049061 [Colocasia esculenta]|uniref:Uncharacterized protein n=1 Tax=Colocasia esculenta TaxID=4460 RepID=A0A843X9Z3_COLES|nr:hypothetical protein [Colocasia esculenta]